jgi:hypothetical protein
MSSSADALKIVQSLAKRTRSARFGYNALLAYADKYLAHAVDNDPSLEDFADSPKNLMTAYLMELEKNGTVELRYTDGQIATISYPEYYNAVIRAAYDRLTVQPDRPFPNEELLPIRIPADLIQPVDVKGDFVRWIGHAEQSGKNTVLRLLFPDSLNTMVCNLRALPQELPKYCVHKIRQYLRVERNAGYMRSKLASIFKQREAAMKDMVNSILTTTDQALRTVFQPTDFTFHFWTQLSSSIIKDYSQKKEKTADEHGFCQASYLLGYYNLYHRGVQQRTVERETAMRQLENNLRRAPYIFSINEIQQFADQRGVPLSRKLGMEDFNHYIAERIQPGDGESLPQMIRVKAVDGKEYYLYRDYVSHVLFEHLFTARREYREHYIRLWSTALQKGNRPREMMEDDAFDADVEAKLRDDDPLLFSLLNYNLLYLTRHEAGTPTDVAADIDELIDEKQGQMRPLAEVLNLDRRLVSHDARLLLPFWMAVPVLSGIVAFFRKLFVGPSREEREQRSRRSRGSQRSSGRSASTTTATFGRQEENGGGASSGTSSASGMAPAGAAASGGDSRKAQLTRFRAAARDLQKSYVPAGSTAAHTLSTLIERWNPLLDTGAKENLVEDVNSLTRDYLRRRKVTYRLIPPTHDNVEQWASDVVRADTLSSQIRRIDDLKEYVKLYILTVLAK